MAEERVLQKVQNCTLNFELENVKSVVKEALDAGVRPEKIIDAMSRGMNIIGERYEKHEYFLTELIMAGETMKAGLEPLLPYTETLTAKLKGVVVMGTVQGDIHDIGKNIVVAFLTSAGFRVHDLGVDVPAEKFVEKAMETKAEIVGMSTLYTPFMPNMKAVIEALKKAGIRDRVKVIVGGAPVDESYAREIGADAYGRDAVEAVRICMKWVSKSSYLDISFEG